MPIFVILASTENSDVILGKNLNEGDQIINGFGEYVSNALLISISFLSHIKIIDLIVSRDILCWIRCQQRTIGRSREFQILRCGDFFLLC